jgi:acyl-CoA hydrolase/GNAT superfamily N-acetyltransferase
VPDAPWTQRLAHKVSSPEAAMDAVRPGRRVFIGSGAAEPQLLVKALTARSGGLADTEIVHILTLGVAPYVEPRFERGFHLNAFFVGANVREAVAEVRADYTPVFLSEIPRLFRSGRMPIDVALIQVSPPDAHGYMSLGVSVDIVKSAAESARHVIAQVNARMPRVHGDAFLHVDQVHALVPGDEDILEAAHGEPDDVALRIGRHVAGLVEDGSTLQMGIGTIPDAVLSCLGDKRDLGVHTEMFSDGVIDLVERGVITGRRKALHPGKIITSFVMGSRRLYDWVHDNPGVVFHPTEYTNDPFRIARHDRMVAINSALEVDLTGQVCADSLGTYFYSGIGGQVDFIRGASRSQGGKAVIALPATARGGTRSRIVPTLQPGAGVVTSRGDVRYVATEFGCVDLHGKTIRERALALIHLAHPDFREGLLEEAKERGLLPRDQVAVLGAGTPEIERLETQITTHDDRPLTLRPVRPTDEGPMREAFYDLSEETKLSRYHAYTPTLPPGLARQRASADYEAEMGLVAVHETGERTELVATGRYFVDPASRAAEVAFLVADAWQGLGLGTTIFSRLVEIARDRGITTFTAEVLAGNARMLQVFHEHAPGAIRSRLEDGVYHLEMDLQDAPA